MEIKDQHTDIETLIVKFFSGEINLEELHVLDTWRKTDVSNEIRFQEYRKSWILVDDNFISENTDIDAEWNIQLQRIRNSAKPKQFKISPLLQIAATIILVFVSGILLNKYMFSYQKISASNEIATIELPDGSNVLLNRSSQLKYEKKFTSKERRVKLTGEAYFTVQKDTNRPFIVETEKLMVEVLGTRFNVFESISENYTEVIVDEGVVRVNARVGEKKEIIMNANESVRLFHTSGDLKKFTMIDENNLAYKTGKLKFRNRKLSYVVNKLNKTYDANLVIISPGIADCRFTSTFEDQDLASILTVIKATLNLQISERGNQMFLSGEGCD